MAVHWSTPELAARFSRYVDEVRDFLATSSVHFGSADDLAAVAIRIDAVPSFRDDLTSLVRAIILREGGFVPRTNLLEILAIAIGGSEFDQAGREIQEPLGRILAFINGVMAKPWNQPPGETRLRPEILAAPREMPPRASREESPAPQEPSPVTGPGEFPMEGYGAMLAARHKVVPISTRRPLESRKPASAPSHADWLIAAGGTIPPPHSQSDGMFSRLNHVERKADTRPGLNPAPTSVPDPVPPPQPPPIASTRPHVPAIEPNPAPAAFVPPPTPASPAAVEVRNAAPNHRTVFLSSSSVEDPSSPPIADVSVPRTGRATSFLPKLSIPNLKLPKFSALRPSVARVSPVVLFGVALVGVAIFAAVRGFVSQPHAQFTARAPALAAAAASAVTPPAATPIDTATVTPELTPAPTTDRPSKPSAYGSLRDDDYIAPPYSRPIPGQPNPVQPSAAVAAPPPATPAADLRPASYSSPAPRPIDPDATYVGASAEERAADSPDSSLPPRRRSLAVSSGAMRSNLLDAPAPGYPLLAKIAHVQGQVVVEAVIRPDGTVSDARVLSGHHLLRGAAVDAVRRWRYRPYVVNGQPQEVSTTVTLDFPTAAGAASQQVSKSASRPIATQQAETGHSSVGLANPPNR